MAYIRSPRREVIRRFYENGAVWGLGNGLVSTSLLTYLASNYGAKGFYISLILAAPRLVGVLRLGTPLWIDKLGDARKFSIAAFLVSALFLLIMSVIGTPGVMPTAEGSLVALVLLWTLYHFFQFLGVVSLWAWIGETVPRQLRGRFIGRRGAILNACQVISLILSGWGNYRWKVHCNEIGQPEQIWYGYILCAAMGAVVMIAALWPLVRAAKRTPIFRSQTLSQATTLQDVLKPFSDRGFQKYLVYGCWFSLANGIAILPITIYRIYVLQVSYGVHLTLDGASQGVQSLAMPYCGRALDRWGGVPVLTIAQILVALALGFYLIASPQQWWWIIGAYVLWIAYAGINTAMPKLMLSFSPPGEYAAYSAAWFSTLELAFGLTMLVGGLLFDWAKEAIPQLFPERWEIDHFTVLFATGLILRLSAAYWASRIEEPTPKNNDRD